MGWQRTSDCACSAERSIQRKAAAVAAQVEDALAGRQAPDLGPMRPLICTARIPSFDFSQPALENYRSSMVLAKRPSARTFCMFLNAGCTLTRLLPRLLMPGTPPGCKAFVIRTKYRPPCVLCLKPNMHAPVVTHCCNACSCICLPYQRRSLSSAHGRAAQHSVSLPPAPPRAPPGRAPPQGRWRTAHTAHAMSTLCQIT